MPSLRCPKCSTIVPLVAEVAPVCPQCGFSGANPLVAKPEPMVTAKPVASEPRNVETAGPAPSVVATPKAHTRNPNSSQRKLVVGAVIAFVIIIGAIVFWASSSTLGRSASEGELNEALGVLRHGPGDSVSEAFGLEGSVHGVTGEDGETSSITFRMVYDPSRPAYEFSYSSGRGGDELDVSFRQVGPVINYVGGGRIYEGRDADPSTLPRLMGLAEIQDLTGLPVSFLASNDLVVEDRDGVQHSGQEATRFVVESGDNSDQRANVIVYNSPPRLARIEFGTSVVDALYGRDLDVHVTQDHSRTSFALGGLPFGAPTGPTLDACRFGAGLSAECVVPADHSQEVPLKEVELRALHLDEAGTSAASLRADATSLSGAGVTLSFEDVDADGLFSAGDRYAYDFGDQLLRFEFYDLWAQEPAGGPAGVPGVEMAAILGALGVALSVLRHRPRQL